jgi:hypothetical protein
VLRQRGIQAGDAAPLRVALELADEIGAVPLAARLRLELGRLAGDGQLETSGRSVLERLGDREAAMADPIASR